MIAREGGSRHSRPTASVTKPGVSIKAPAIATSRPSSSSLVGNSPALTRCWKRMSKPSPSRRTRNAAAPDQDHQGDRVESTDHLCCPDQDPDLQDRDDEEEDGKDAEHPLSVGPTSGLPDAPGSRREPAL